MRLRDIIRSSGVRYLKEFTGRTRRARRAIDAAKDRVPDHKPKNWSRDKHKRRAEQKRRRKQVWK